MRKILLSAFAALFLMAPTAIKAQTTALDIASDMYPGINLGNTMEACPCTWLNNKLDWETGWQPTKTTQQIIDYIKQQGFKSVRIPVAWYMHSDSNRKIDAAWMDRVQEIVDYCINDGLYVLLNDHWDNGWVENSFGNISESNITANCATMKTLWTQIAERFKDYDNHLLFAGLNEPNAGDDSNTVAALIRYEQAFIDAVRATGGNNGSRMLVVQGPNTDIDKTNALYDVTKLHDTAPLALMVEVHFYGPYNFVMMMNDEWWGNMAFYWGAGNSVSGSKHNSTWGDEAWVKQQMNAMKEKFTKHGIPVIIGEYAAEWRTMPAGENQDKHNASIKAWYKTVTQEALSAGCVPMVWDTNNDKGIIDRKNLSIDCQYAMDGINEGLKAATWPFASGIGIVADDNALLSACAYNLQGMRVGSDYRGIVIQNGKKSVRH